MGSLVCRQDADVDAPKVIMALACPGHAHELGVTPRDGVSQDGLLLEGLHYALQQLSAGGCLLF